MLRRWGEGRGKGRRRRDWGEGTGGRDGGERGRGHWIGKRQKEGAPDREKAGGRKEGGGTKKKGKEKEERDR